jgi:hypothetical protein
MNPFLKKEIRLLLPSWAAALLLALVQVFAPAYNFYITCLLFVGLTGMALTSMGRETSLNTFSFLLAQPAERLRIWQTKLAVLAVAFLTVLGAWLAAFVFSLFRHSPSSADLDDAGYLLITVCLAATATFTGGLWTTLLLRQVTAAIWLTLLVPATLCGVTAGVFVSQNQSSYGVIAGLCVVFAVYSIGGFFFARRLFFRAQDVGWSGGVISLPDWPFSARRVDDFSLRRRKPLLALLKKEFQLQQVSLMGAAGLLVLHTGTLILRKYYQSIKDSAGEVVTGVFLVACVFWILWLVLPIFVGCLAVAEERRLGVMEGQLCLPASRRVQFTIKGLVTLFLCILLGAVMPVLLEAIGFISGVPNPVLMPENGAMKFFFPPLALVISMAGLALVCYFASSLAQNFLQAIGFAIITFMGCAMIIPAFTRGWMFFFESPAVRSVLSLVIAVPTLIVTLLWLAYRNYKNYREGWPLWRSNLLGFTVAMAFVVVSSTGIYNRAWEVFEPAEPAHGPAKLSLANPPALQLVQNRNLLVRLPDGRFWFDYLTYPAVFFGEGRLQLSWALIDPLPRSAGPQRFVAGSNWLAVATEYLNIGWRDPVSDKQMYSSGYFDTVGIQPDGTLWVSGKSETNEWLAGPLQRFGSETNWRQLAQGSRSVVLLKNDGTLWRWGSRGSFSSYGTNWPQQWPGLRALQPYQIGTNADWQELFTLRSIYARQADGSVWRLGENWKTGTDELERATNLDAVVSQTASRTSDYRTAFVRADGTLWVLNRYWDEKNRQMVGTGILQVGKENDWRSVAVTWNMMVALKTDGSLWQWHLRNEPIIRSVNIPPTRLGIHQDWVAIANVWGGVFALAADGSLWLWPDKILYESETLLKLPKQPRYLGNVFSKAD